MILYTVLHMCVYHIRHSSGCNSEGSRNLRQIGEHQGDRDTMAGAKSKMMPKKRIVKDRNVDRQNVDRRGPKGRKAKDKIL